MREYKEQCEALVKAGATILVRDGFTKAGIPMYVTRKVTGCYGIKRGRNSEWGVTVDRPFEDGADGVSYGLVLGINIGGKVELRGLYYDMEICGRQFSDEERTMILSDAESRLKMAHKESYSNSSEKFFLDTSNWNSLTAGFISFLKHNSESQDFMDVIDSMIVQLETDGRYSLSVDKFASLKQSKHTTPTNPRRAREYFQNLQK